MEDTTHIIHTESVRDAFKWYCELRKRHEQLTRDHMTQWDLKCFDCMDKKISRKLYRVNNVFCYGTKEEGEMKRIRDIHLGHILLRVEELLDEIEKIEKTTPEHEPNRNYDDSLCMPM